MASPQPPVKHPRPLDVKAFPKTCANCQRVYQNDMEFIQQTTPVTAAPSHIKVVENDEGQGPDVFLEVFRNCACGSTLMELFHCRRDLSEKGIRRRVLFGVFLQALQQAGYEPAAARALLLEFMAIVADHKPS